MLFADGTAAREVPDAAPAFSSAEWRRVLPPVSVGRWKAVGGGYALSLPDGARRLKSGSGGLVDAADGAQGKFDVYFAVPSKSSLAGCWRRISVSSVGGAAGCSEGALEFRADGRFAESRQGFATSETATAVGAAKGSGGRWRLDGPLLTREEGGKRTVTLAFRMPEWDGKDVLIGGERWEPADS